MGKKSDYPKGATCVFTEKWIKNNEHNKKLNTKQEFTVVGWGGAGQDTVRVKKKGSITTTTHSYHVTFIKLKMEEFTIGEVICTKYKVDKVKSIDGDTITLESIYTDKEKICEIEVERSRLIELKQSSYAGMITVLSRLHEDKANKYKHIIVDLKNNIAISKIPKTKFREKTIDMNAAKYKSFYNKNIKLLFVRDGDVPEGETLIEIEDGFDKFMEDMGFFLWGDMTLEIFGNVCDYYREVKDKYEKP